MQAQWPHHVILRSSIIYGPNSPQPVSRRLFLQFVDGALRDGPPTTFFADEWRSPVYVHDICRICETLLQLGMPVHPLSDPAACLKDCHSWLAVGFHLVLFVLKTISQWLGTVADTGSMTVLSQRASKKHLHGAGQSRA